MGLLDDVEAEERDDQGSDRDTPTRLTAFYIAVALLPVLFLFNHLGRFHLGLNIYICLFVNAIAVRTHWELRKYFSFWAVMVLVLALEVPVILMAKWPHGWVPGAALLPIALAGYLVATGAIHLLEKFAIGTAPSTEGE